MVRRQHKPEDREMTQSQVAKSMGISRQLVDKIEKSALRKLKTSKQLKSLWSEL